MKAIKISLLILFSISVMGCNALFDPQPQPQSGDFVVETWDGPVVIPGDTKAPKDNTPKDNGLNLAVKRALKGHAATAKSYAAIYRAEADLTEMEKSPFKRPDDVARNTEKLKPVFGQKPGEIPEFTAIVAAHLAFKDAKDKDPGPGKMLDKPFDAEYRAWLVNRLRQLSAACAEAAK